jgi:8-oxo-dGTP pyrophosphatase MutT (NUDIX family)
MPSQKPSKTSFSKKPSRKPKRPHPIREKSCGIVLFRREKSNRFFLLLHYPGGHWDFGKGHVELNEDEKTTALREMREETGIKNIAFLEGFRHKVDYFYRRDRKLYHKDVIFFIGETGETGVKLSHEHQGYAWLPYEEALHQLTFDNAKLLLKKSENVLRKFDESDMLPRVHPSY